MKTDNTITPVNREDFNLPAETFTYDDGQVVFEFSTEWLSADEFVTLVIQGEANSGAEFPEGAPRIIHAVYCNLQGVWDWLYAIFDHDDLTAADARELVGGYHQKFLEIVGTNTQTGRNWVLGMNRRAGVSP